MTILMKVSEDNYTGFSTAKNGNYAIASLFAQVQAWKERR